MKKQLLIFMCFLSCICFSQNSPNYLGKIFMAEVSHSCEMYEDGTVADVITYSTINIIDENHILIKHIDEIDYDNVYNTERKYSYKWSSLKKQIIIKDANLAFGQILRLEFRNNKVFAILKKHKKIKEIEFKEVKNIVEGLH